MSFRDELDERFARTVAGARRPDGLPGYRLPGPLAETIVEAQRREACPPSLISYYTNDMPRLLVEQQTPDDAARALLWRPIDLSRTPKLREALDGVFAALAQVGLDAERFCGAPSPAALIAARPSVAALYAHSFFGGGLPLLGAWPGERALYARELHDPDRVVDLRLSGNLVHELCHGPRVENLAAPWMILEAAAIHLGLSARRAHVFPDEPGEAVPGGALFVCLGQALARRLGRRALWSVLLGEPLADGARFDDAAWADWNSRREPPFARDALAAMDWIKLAWNAPADTPWREISWWHEEPTDEDRALVEDAVRAVCQVNVFRETFQTWPSDPPEGRLTVEVEACRIAALARKDGVFAEPAFWLLPPPLMRRLHERGARRVIIEGMRRDDIAGVASALLQICLDDGALDGEMELEWDPSR